MPGTALFEKTAPAPAGPEQPYANTTASPDINRVPSTAEFAQFGDGEFNDYLNFELRKLSGPDYAEPDMQAVRDLRLEALVSLKRTTEEFRGLGLKPDEIARIHARRVGELAPTSTPQERDVRNAQLEVAEELADMLGDPYNRANMRDAMQHEADDHKARLEALVEQEAADAMAADARETIATEAHPTRLRRLTPQEVAQAADLLKTAKDSAISAGGTEFTVTQESGGGMSPDAIAAAQRIIAGLNVTSSRAPSPELPAQKPQPPAEAAKPAPVPKPAAERAAPQEDERTRQIRLDAERVMRSARRVGDTSLEDEQNALIPVASMSPEWTDKNGVKRTRVMTPQDWANKRAALKRYNEITTLLREPVYRTSSIDDLQSLLQAVGFAPDSVARLVNLAKESGKGHPEAVFSVNFERNERGDLIETNGLAVSKNVT